MNEKGEAEDEETAGGAKAEQEIPGHVRHLSQSFSPQLVLNLRAVAHHVVQGEWEHHVEQAQGGGEEEDDGEDPGCAAQEEEEEGEEFAQVRQVIFLLDDVGGEVAGAISHLQEIICHMIHICNLCDLHELHESVFLFFLFQKNFCCTCDN